LARDYHCKECGEAFPHPRAVSDHKVEQHGAEPRTSRQRAGRPAGGKATTADAEASLLTKAIELFTNADTDRSADFRVLEYLEKRFGPSAYEGAGE
jgi:hypothetical protein